MDYRPERSWSPWFAQRKIERAEGKPRAIGFAERGKHELLSILAGD